MTDDLLVYTSARDEQRARIAGALSVTAIVMLLVTSFTLARGVQWTTGAGQDRGLHPEAKTESVADQMQVNRRAESASAPTTFDCPRLRGNQWLRAMVCQQGDLTLAGCDCIYGYANSTRFTQ